MQFTYQLTIDIMFKKGSENNMGETFKNIMISALSGIAGVALSIGYQHFFAPPQSFTFIYNGEEMVVTETEYLDLVNKLSSTQQSLESAQNELKKIKQKKQIETSSNNNNESFLPLSNLKLSASRFLTQIQDRSLEDTIGNTYESGNLFEMCAEDNEYGYASFYLGGKYKKITGNIAISDESDNENELNKQLESYIEIYSKNGENYNLLYTSPILNKISSPINLSTLNLDLSDCEWLEIRHYNNGTYYFYGPHSLRILLANVIVEN